ncbi:MAG: hypothetical protein RLZ25_2422 [Pseudomonadota bacterium]
MAQPRAQNDTHNKAFGTETKTHVLPLRETNICEVELQAGMLKKPTPNIT